MGCCLGVNTHGGLPSPTAGTAHVQIVDEYGPRGTKSRLPDTCAPGASAQFDENMPPAFRGSVSEAQYKSIIAGINACWRERGAVAKRSWFSAFVLGPFSLCFAWFMYLRALRQLEEYLANTANPRSAAIGLSWSLQTYQTWSHQRRPPHHEQQQATHYYLLVMQTSGSGGDHLAVTQPVNGVGFANASRAPEINYAASQPKAQGNCAIM